MNPSYYHIHGGWSRPKSTADRWVTGEGVSIAVHLLSDQHLKRTIRYLQRKAAQEALVDQALENSLPAPVLMEAATLECFLEENYPTWPALKAELKKRGLDGPRAS